MGGILGGAQSQGSSQSSAEQRQALFFPTDDAIVNSLGALQNQFATAQGALQPYSLAGTAAIDQMRLLMGMEPIDPLQNELSGLQALAQQTEGATVYDQFNNPFHFAAPYQQASAALTSLINSDDPAEREDYYQQALNLLDNAQQSVDQFILRAQGINPAAGKRDGTSQERIDWPSLKILQDNVAEREKLSASIRQDYEPGTGPKPLTQAEIEAKLMQDPGYQFRFNQGTRAVEQSAAARGGLYSGRAAKELERFGSDLAAQQYQQTLGNYAGLAGLGGPFVQQSAGQYTNLGQLLMAGQQDIGREWNMSPWTARSQSSSQQSSSSSNGIGDILGFAAGLF